MRLDEEFGSGKAKTQPQAGFFNKWYPNSDKNVRNVFDGRFSVRPQGEPQGGGESIERRSMRSSVPEKQKPSHRLGSLISGARTRTKTSGTFLTGASASARRASHREVASQSNGVR